MPCSIRKRPQPEVGANNTPHLCQPPRLEDKEHDDGQSEDKFPKRGHGQSSPGEDLEVHNVLRHHAQCFIQHGDEDGPEYRARYAPETPDNDHSNILYGKKDGKRLRRDTYGIVRPQSAGESGIKRADAEGKQLIFKYGNTHPFGSQIVVTDSDEGTTIPATNEVDRHPAHDGKAHKYHPEKGSIAADIEAEEGCRRKHYPFRPAREALPVHEDIFDDKLAGQRGDAEVEVFETDRGDTEDHPRHGRNEPCGEDREPEGQPHLGGQESSGVRPYPEKGPVAQ